MSHTWRVETACSSRGRSEGGAVGPELSNRPTVPLRHKLIMHIALHSDRTDLTVSQTQACGEIIIYSEAYWKGNVV